MMRKRNLKRGCAGVITALTTACLFGGCGNAPAAEETMVLEEKDFSKTVVADGTVECSDPEYVYSTLKLPVKEVFVEVGDTVKEGDVICVLDTATVEDEIELKIASMELSEKNAASSLTAAKHKYDTISEGLEYGTDATLVAAYTRLQNAADAWVTTEKAYQDYKNSIDRGTDRELLAADQAVATAANAVQQARSMQAEYDDHKDEEEEHITDIMIEQAEDNVESACLTYQQAIERRDNLIGLSDVTLSDYARNSQVAQMEFLLAQNEMYAAMRTVEKEKQTSADAVAQARLAGDMSVKQLELEQLQKKLDDSVITAKASGTVTVVNINPGEQPDGIMFVIEDTSDLVVTARVEEADINAVAIGQTATVTLKSDDGRSYNAIVEDIAPSAIKNSSNKTDTSGEDAEYNVKLKLQSPDNMIKIGMNTDVEITVLERQACFTVPDSAVYTDDDGENYVYAVKDSGKTIDSLKVEKGESSGRNTVISGAGVASGVVILNDAEKAAK